MDHPSRAIAGLILVFLSQVIPVSFGQSRDVDWATDRGSEWTTSLTLSASDKRDITRLAADMGLRELARVVVDHFVPGFCEFVRVESVAAEEGNRRSWLELRMRPRQWRECSRPERGTTVRRVGRWIAASSDLEKEERWRIRDGEQWSVEVELDDDAMYTDAVVIARAIRRSELVNRVPAIELAGGQRLEMSVPDLSADHVSSIRRDPKAPGGYVVRVGSMAGDILFVRVADGKVEVYGLSSWLV